MVFYPLWEGFPLTLLGARRELFSETLLQVRSIEKALFSGLQADRAFFEALRVEKERQSKLRVHDNAPESKLREVSQAIGVDILGAGRVQ